jgi:SAM-dependent methyltransferase
MPKNVFTSFCRSSDFFKSEYLFWCEQIKEKPRFHRKQWEYVFILNSLYEKNLLKPDNYGLGFAVGNEPLPDLFASYNINILATDLIAHEAKKLGWVDTGQHCKNIADLNKRKISDKSTFNKRVKFEYVDMNSIPKDLDNFDFCWSSCSLEHLGSIEKGLLFIKNSLDTLKPGGVAVHTTEFNLSSDDETIDLNPSCVLFRKKDLLSLPSIIGDKFLMETIVFEFGNNVIDNYIDLPPYINNPHLKLKIDKFTSTSVGLIFQKK